MKNIVKKSELSYVAVSNWEKARHFFVDLLGMRVSSCDEGYHWMELSGSEEGGAILGVCLEAEAYPNPVKPGQNAIVTLNVEDVAQSKAHLAAQGVKFLGEIIEVPGHVKMALFEDPDGNKFQLVQVLS